MFPKPIHLLKDLNTFCSKSFHFKQNFPLLQFSYFLGGKRTMVAELMHVLTAGQVRVRHRDGSDTELRFDRLVLAAGGDSGAVGDLLGMGAGEGDLRWAVAHLVIN